MPKHNQHPAQLLYLGALALYETYNDELKIAEAHFDEGFDLFDGTFQEFDAIYRAEHPERAAELDDVLARHDAACKRLRAAEIDLVRWAFGEARKVATTKEQVEAMDVCDRMIAAPHRYPKQWAQAIDNACRLAA